MCKILELYDQNPWTNNQSKLATFEPILQRPHSAMVRAWNEINYKVHLGSDGQKGQYGNREVRIEEEPT